MTNEEAQIAALTAEIEQLKAKMVPDYYYGEGMEEECFTSVREILEIYHDADPFVEPTVLSIDTAIRGPKIWVSIVPTDDENGFDYLEHDSEESARAAEEASFSGDVLRWIESATHIPEENK